MSSHTIQLGTLIEQASQYEQLPTRERIERGRPNLFDFEYPFFDDDYKAVFETNFIRNFYQREIGFETEGLFKMRLENWLHLNMPYYNQMFKSELMEFDPFENYDMRTEHKTTHDRTQKDLSEAKQNSKGNTVNDSENKSNETSNITENNFNRDISSDTPDNRLAITTQNGRGVIQYASQIDEHKADNARSATSTNNSTGKSTDKSEIENNQQGKHDSVINSLEDYVEHRHGSHGVKSFSELLIEYRETFIRIERQIFDEMQQLFMLVYS